MGGIGYMMIRYDYSRLVLVVALVLGPTAERSYFQSMLISDGSWSIFFERTPSLILSVITILLIVYPIVSWVVEKSKKAPALRGAGHEEIFWLTPDRIFAGAGLSCFHHHLSRLGL